ncbi:protein adenylyltransferase SelO [Leucobacter tenebrionis]|uniref:protein adenylyltransferase SelO n=1 Tax=Leucobacter tenebrionis TaxID=2873270 RepID=UPI001CA79E28|nr:YdiU family protein [Leucobacter tenebrionis]QZY51974.1 YdiU family protein [Leucobacter tenebrionis]
MATTETSDDTSVDHPRTDPAAPRERSLGGGPLESVELGSSFADRIPELALPWKAMRPEHPAILALNEPLARELGIDPGSLRGERGVRWLLGNELSEGSRPVAQVYSGHQFGAYSPRLGDGRALLLGEIVDAAGTMRDLHLKGSGRTPFARGGDGFAAVGPMLREYLMGEAMHALGIPTTRALTVVATGQRVMRDDSLDPLPGAVLARVASSHLRVGTFQYARSLGDIELLRRLADFAIERHYPELAAREHPYLALLEAVIDAQARLVASWMLVGFVHGVMNTDNMTISGETIDYGPCAFMDAYDPATVFSSIDHRGRYAYGAQPAVAGWNLTRFAEAVLPLLSDDPGEAERLALGALQRFGGAYDEAWTAGMRRKLGLASGDADRAAGGAGAAGVTGTAGVTGAAGAAEATGAAGGSGAAEAAGTADDEVAPSADDESVAALAAELLRELHEQGLDYTGAFRALAEAARVRGGRGAGGVAGAGGAGAGSGGGAGGAEPESYAELFRDGREPGPWFERWLSLSPDPAAMDAVNPVYIPRNHLVDEALVAATDGDLAPFEELLDAVTRPYAVRPGLERYAAPDPEGRRHITYCGT